MLYGQPPLPFVGNKRNWRKELINVINKIPNNKKYLYVDVFGGSGFISHLISWLKPNNKVIWNDYDNYQERLNNIDVTNQIINEIRASIDTYIRNRKLTPREKATIMYIIDKHIKKGDFIDYVTLGANLLFNSSFVCDVDIRDCLEKKTFYNTIIKKEYNADNYFNTNVYRIVGDYKEILKKYNSNNTIFFLDPPYFNTDKVIHYNDNFMSLSEYLDFCDLIKDFKYVLFGSEKGCFLDIMKKLDNNYKITELIQKNNLLFIAGMILRK